MLIKLKSNGKEIEMAKKDFDLFSDDQKRSYTILNKEDNPPKKQVTENVNTHAAKEEKTKGNDKPAIG